MKCIPVFLLMIGTFMVQCSTGNEPHGVVNYPASRPDSVALPFLPGIVCTDSLDFNSAFSPDGKSFFFSRSLNGRYNIYMTSFDGENWGDPILAPFSKKEYSEADPFITPDGSLYYISNRPKDEYDSVRDFDIWVARLQEDGRWSIPENLEAVNSDSTEYYVSLAANGNLYFASNRQGSYGSHDIYVSRLVNKKYTTPENLGPAVNSIEMEHDPFISRDEQFLIFTAVNREDTYGAGDLYYSVKAGDKSWTPASNMGGQINTSTYDYCPYVSPDSRYFFYSTDYDVKWIDAKYLPVNGK